MTPKGFAKAVFEANYNPVRYPSNPSEDARAALLTIADKFPDE